MPDLKTRVCESYLNGMSGTRIAKNEGLSFQYVYDILHREGIKTRPTRRIKLREDFDSLEGKYWLGFIFADGYVEVKPRRWRITVEISDKDRDQLERMREFFGSDLSIVTRTRKGKKMSRVVLCSKKLASVASEYKNGEAYKNLSDEELRFFIAGVFDGDGYVGKSKNKYTGAYNYEWSIVGDYEFIEWLRGRLQESFDVRFSVKTHSNTDRVVSARTSGRNQVGRMMEYLDEVGLGMPRKRWNYA